MTEDTIKGWVVQLEDGRYLGRIALSSAPLSPQPFAFAAVYPDADGATFAAQGHSADPVYAVVPVVAGPHGMLIPQPGYLPDLRQGTAPDVPALVINVYMNRDQWGDGLQKAVRHAIEGAGHYHTSHSYTPEGEPVPDHDLRTGIIVQLIPGD